MVGFGVGSRQKPTSIDFPGAPVATAPGLLVEARPQPPLSYSFQSVMESAALRVEVAGPNLIVSGGGFCAVYYKSSDQPQLILRLRTKTDDYQLLTRAWVAANAKARELGWIV